MQNRQVVFSELSPLAVPNSMRLSVVDAIHAIHAAFDIWPAFSEQMTEAREFAAALIGGEIVTAQTLDWVHERTGAAVFLAREEGRLTGVWAAVLLSEAGVLACHADRFNALDPDARHVAAAPERPAGLYIWGVAGSTRRSAARVVAAHEAVVQATDHVPRFARPMTEAGRRLAARRNHFTPVHGSTSGLVWIGARGFQPGVAA